MLQFQECSSICEGSFEGKIGNASKTSSRAIVTFVVMVVDGCLGKGAALGLDYLHTGTSTQHGVIHRDVKTSNILLDSNFAAKISDFGLAKVTKINQTRTHVSTLIKGTFGYIDPNYFHSGKLTRKSDVYSFGVVLFEVLTGKQALDPTFDEDRPSLAVWAQDHFKERRLNDIIDHRLMGQISKKCLKEFSSIAVQCLHNQPKQRPTMAEVVFKLESLLSIEKEHVGSHVDDGRFINNVRYLFTGKANLMSTHAEGSKSEISDKYIKISSNQIIRTFTYAELVSLTNDWAYPDVIKSIGYVHKGWVDELTYAPTVPGIGLAIYVKKKRVRLSKLDLDLNTDKFDHPNLFKLLGYCLEMQNLFYVYKLVPLTSLDTLLFGGADNKPVGLIKTKITYRESDTTPYFSSAVLNAKDCLKPSKIKTLNAFCI
ncbi:hypothetical protein E3N88_32890 [Mikania micrantha]|uniref:Protein kinase domain-containing protein n=1 Tax=Mikania micrantha TaxID=192012 RepID=A0A5N6M9V1_9ASTR|nr:hypothetical protein E3N88_32890 [Mikania micrantha]